MKCFQRKLKGLLISFIWFHLLCVDAFPSKCFNENAKLTATMKKSRWHAHWSEPQIENILLTARINRTLSLKEYLVSQGFVYDAASSVQLVELDHGIFAVKRTGGDEEGVGEVAAYHFNRYLGLDLVPPTVKRKIDGEWTTLQLFVKGNPNFMDDRTSIEDVAKVVSKKDFNNMNLLAFVTGQYDNHKSNMLVDINNRLTMFDFEVIRIIQQVRYGEFPFVRRGLWTVQRSPLDQYENFPFDRGQALKDPSIEEMRKVFSPYWPPNLVQTFHRYVAHMPQKELKYVRWRGYIWVQNRVSSRRVAVVTSPDASTLQALRQMQQVDLRKIFPKPVFKELHLELTMQRANQVLDAFER